MLRNKLHLGIGENCSCGGVNCNCELQVYGELFENSGIYIYRIGKTEDYAENELETAAKNVKDAYENMQEVDQEYLEGKIHEIHIYPVADGATAYFYRNEDGKLIVGFRSNASVNVMTIRLGHIGEGSIKPDIEQISVLFGDSSYSVTVKGFLTDTDGVADKVKEALEAGFEATDDFMQDIYKTYFEENNVVVIVEDTMEYAKYKTVKGETAVMYFNLTALTNGNLTGVVVSGVFAAMYFGDNSVDE
jgi:hypothetical protein